MRNSRKTHTQPPAAPPVHYAGGALALLLLPGVWIATGGVTPRFWVAVLTGGVTLVVIGAVVWWTLFRPQTPGALLRASSRRRQTFASLTTGFGLLLLGWRLWSAPDAAAPATLAATITAVWALLAGVALQTSLLSAAAQWTTRRLGLRELHVILQLAVAALLLLPAEQPAWMQAAAPNAASGAAVAAWMLPAVVVGVALFAGLIALHGLRRPGAAVMIFAAVLFLRALANFALAQSPGAAAQSAVAPFLALVPAAALDVVYVLRADADAQLTLRAALTAGIVAALVAALLFLPRLPGFPPPTAATGLIAVGTCAVVGVWCGWCGAAYGHALAGRPSSSRPRA